MRPEPACASSRKGRRPAVAVLAVALAVAVMLPAPAAFGSTASSQAVARGLDYVASCQRSDGGFSEKSASTTSDALTAWTIVALASAGQDPNAWRVGGRSPVDYLSGQSAKWKSITDDARTALAACAAGRNPRSFGGVDLVARIRAAKRSRGDAGDSFGLYVNSHIWSLIALKAAGETPTARELAWLRSEQNADGGWGWAPQVASDSNDTAAALEALLACGEGRSSSAVKRGLTYLHGAQVSGGGLNYGSGLVDANSTAWGMQAIIAAGQDLGGSAWQRGGGTPLTALMGLQESGGSVRFTVARTSNPLLATIQAIPALCARPFPLSVGTLQTTAFRSAPRVGLVFPAAGATVSWPANAVLRVLVDDGTGTGVDAASFKVTVDGVKVAARLSGSTAEVGPLRLANGSHAVVVTAKDRAGNAVTGSAERFTVAAASAVTPVAQPGSGATAAVTAAPTAGRTAADGTALAPGDASQADGPDASPTADAGIDPAVVAAVALIVLGAVGLCVALGVMGYRRLRTSSRRGGTVKP